MKIYALFPMGVNVLGANNSKSNLGVYGTLLQFNNLELKLHVCTAFTVLAVDVV